MKGNPVTPEQYLKGLTGGPPTSGISLSVRPHGEIEVSAGNGFVIHGSKVRSFVRTYDPASGDMHHDFLEFEKGERSNGSARAMMKNGLQLYTKMGAKSVSVLAALEDGAFVWARAGCKYEHHDSALSHTTAVSRAVGNAFTHVKASAHYASMSDQSKKALLKEQVRTSRRLTKAVQQSQTSDFGHVATTLARTRTPMLEAAFVASGGQNNGILRGYKPSPKPDSSGIVKSAMSRLPWGGKIDLQTPDSRRAAMRWAGVRPPRKPRAS